MHIRWFLLLLITLVSFYKAAYSQIVEDRIVVAQYGEGIFAILKRNDLDPVQYLKSFIEINREKIRNDSTLIAGNTYLLPEIIPEKVENIPVKEEATLAFNTHLFGKKYERVTRKSKKLQGAVFYLVSGHGGPDPGAMSEYGKYTLSEDEYAYDVTLRLARNLLEHGAEVHMIITDENDGIRDDPILLMDHDEVNCNKIVISRNQRERLHQRVEAINELYKNHKNEYQRVITIHIDSRNNGENIDVFFYHHSRSKNGQKLSENLHNTIKKKYQKHQPGRPYHGTVSTRNGLYMIRNTLPPIVYIELGNIRNTQDQRRLVIKDNRQALANWLLEGALADYEQFK